MAFRIALAVSMLAYLMALAGGLSGLVSAELASALGIYSGLAIAITALGCVATQLILFISKKKRRIAHG